MAVVDHTKPFDLFLAHAAFLSFLHLPGGGVLVVLPRAQLAGCEMRETPTFVTLLPLCETAAPSYTFADTALRTSSFCQLIVSLEFVLQQPILLLESSHCLPFPIWQLACFLSCLLLADAQVHQLLIGRVLLYSPLLQLCTGSLSYYGIYSGLLCIVVTPVVQLGCLIYLRVPGLEALISLGMAVK